MIHGHVGCNAYITNSQLVLRDKQWARRTAGHCGMFCVGYTNTCPVIFWGILHKV